MRKIPCLVIISFFCLSSILPVVNSIYVEKSTDVLENVLDNGLMDSAWPMQSHDNRHTGRSPYSTQDNLGTEKWRFISDDPETDTGGPITGGIAIAENIENKNIRNYVIDYENHTSLYKIEKPSNEFLLDNNIHSSTVNGVGSMLWSYMDDSYIHQDSCICSNGAYIFTGSLGSKTGICKFQLFNTLGNGIPEWEFNPPYDPFIWSQVDASKESDVLAGLAVSSHSVPPEDSINRLYRWDLDLFKNESCWYFDIPNNLHVFNGGVVEDNLAVSDNGEKIILGTGDFENKMMRIYVFDSDSAKPDLIFNLSCEYPNYAILDVSYDGSIILVSTLYEIIIIDTTVPCIRFRDEDMLLEPGSISGDGSVFIGEYWDDGHCFKAFKWNDFENKYEEIWDKKFVPSGWLMVADSSSNRISDDGSKFIVGFESYDHLETKVFLYDVESGNLLWEHHTIVEGDYNHRITDVCLSEDGSREVVAYSDDEFEMNPEIKVFHGENSIPIFTLDAPATMHSADISPDGNLAVGGGDLCPNYFCYGGIFICSIDLGNNDTRPEKPCINGPSNGKPLENYEYVFSAVDLDDDDVFFFIEWGDGDVEECIGPFDSGEEITLKHNWTHGEYQINAKVKDSKGFYSDWAILTVSMPKSKLNNKFLNTIIFERTSYATINDDDEPPYTNLYYDTATGEVTLIAVDYPLGGQWSGVKATYYKIDSGDFEVYTDPFILPEGTHTVYFYSEDIMGNKENTKSKTLSLDTTPPTVQLTLPQEGWLYIFGSPIFERPLGDNTLCIGKVPIEATADDNDGSGVNKVLFSYNGETGWDDTAPYTNVFTGRVFGDLTISVTAIDNLGHESAPVEITVKCYCLG